MAEAPSTPRTPAVAPAPCEDDWLDGVSAATVAAVRAREAMLLAAKTPESVMAKERAKTMGKLRTVFDTLQVYFITTTTLVPSAASLTRSSVSFVPSNPLTPVWFHLGQSLVRDKVTFGFKELVDRVLAAYRNKGTASRQETAAALRMLAETLPEWCRCDTTVLDDCSSTVFRSIHRLWAACLLFVNDCVVVEVAAVLRDGPHLAPLLAPHRRCLAEAKRPETGCAFLERVVD